jgi:erythromycin esterase-like protein
VLDFVGWLHEAGGRHARLRHRAALGRRAALGVIWRPGTERQSHYFRARAGDQFDAVIHVDETRAVEPLERTASCETGQVPETHPFAV